MLAGESQVSSSLEDYLEAIYHIAEAKGAARAKDIVQAMGVNNSSVTQALRSLSEKKLVNYAPYDVITLTADGEKIAQDVLQRHVTLREFLTTVLGLPTDLADGEACRMEHAIDDEVLERFLCFLAFVNRHRGKEVGWVEEFRRFVSEGSDGQTCNECVRDYLNALQKEFKNDM